MCSFRSITCWSIGINMEEEFTFSDLENGIQIRFLYMMSFVVGMPCLRWFPWKLSNIFKLKVISFLNQKPNCYRTQITGITVISDASGFGFKQARHFTLDIARAGTAFVQVSLRTILKNRMDLIYLISRIVFPYGIDKSMLSMLQGYFISFTTW